MKIFIFWVVKFSIYLNRLVFVMKQTFIGMNLSGQFLRFPHGDKSLSHNQYRYFTTPKCQENFISLDLGISCRNHDKTIRMYVENTWNLEQKDTLKRALHM